MLGVDVGGTFTDLLLIEESSGQIFTAKVPSTPQDSSVGVLNGIERICATAGIDKSAINHVMHGHDRCHEHGADRGPGPVSGWSRPGATSRPCRSRGPMCRAAWAAG